MEFQIQAVCRGNKGKGYVRLAVSGVRPECLTARAFTPAGEGIRCGVYQYGFPGEDPLAVEHWGGNPVDKPVLCVVAVPLLDVDLTVRLYDRSADPNRPVFEFPFRVLESKVRSRLLHKLHPDVADRMNGIDQRRLGGDLYVYVPGIYPVSATNVSVRFVIRSPYLDESRGFRVSAFNADGTRLEDIQPVTIEDTTIYERRDPNLPIHEMIQSIRLPKNPTCTLCLSVEETNTDDPRGNFTCLPPADWEGFINGAYDYTRNAYHDPGYAGWFERRRATFDDLKRQRVVVEGWEYRPKVSVISVLFNTPAEYLTAMLDSVLAQSYADFELVLVNVSGRNPEVDATLAQYDDPRIRIMEAENRNIADNTNVSIAASTGEYIAFVDHDDVIEPDALYQYVSTLQEDRSIDLMYCDEDRLDEGRYEHPFFKPQFNRDWLYSYNYITHMLMVSRHALSQIDLSEADVAGAQDYDLILKISEVARSIKAIPYVLYHWRIHEGSTSSNPGSKPYADDAGRLALSRHFERIGVKAVVHESELPFRYRTEYQRDHDPKVSIVIPTKDHSAMLATCVDSVLRKTTYPNYDITLVENNSVEPDTFAYYERIQKQEPRVKVVTWEGHGFNYSAICNHGANHTDGEIILFLNNDTEIITPEWLDRMVNHTTRPDVGIVGAKLICKDGIISHGGIWVSTNNAGYMGYDLAADDGGYMETMHYPYNPEAVTGACQMISRQLFNKLGGLDETLAVVLNDVDLCLKAEQAGKVTVFEPQALLYHNEHTSRGRDENDPNKQRRADDEYARFFLKWNPVLRPGRYINLNLNQYDGNYKIVY